MTTAMPVQRSYQLSYTLDNQFNIRKQPKHTHGF